MSLSLSRPAFSMLRVAPRQSVAAVRVSVAPVRAFAAGRPKPLLDLVRAQLADIESNGLTKNERVISSPQRAEIKVVSAQGGERTLLNFCANNYLGLSDNLKLISAAKHALDTHGFGLSSVRFICGTQDIHKQLERRLSEFHGTEDTILYGSCFDANGAVFETLTGPEDAIISDELNHASIIDGIRLSRAQRFRFKHMDMADLRAQLLDADAKGARAKIVVTDGVFSMDGDIAPLNEICALCDEFGATLLIDECHATGFLGATGRGSPQHCGVDGRVDIITSTLGKALGGATGGYITGRKEVIALLRQRSRPYLFSNSVAPAVVAAGLEAIDLLSASTQLRDTLERNTLHFRKHITAAGFKVGGKVHPITPIMLGDARLATQFAELMLAEGIYVIGFSFPVVPKGAARIRVQVSAGHTIEQLDRAIAAFVKIGKQLGVI